MWTRQTQWRQGTLLSAGSAVALRVVNEADADTRVLIAASHDCDIVTDNLSTEPTVEFVVGQVIDKVDGSYTRTKNARILHLEFETPDGKKAVAFSIKVRVEIQKADLADHAPDSRWTHASPMGITSLRWWLAARYLRSSFPDTFEARLTQSKVAERFDRLLSPLGDFIYGIFFLVDDGDGLNHASQDPHELRAVVVYDSGLVDEENLEKIERMVDALRTLFKRTFYDEATASWRKIELVSCNKASDEVFSFANSRIFKQWRLEHRSLSDDSQPLPIQSV